MKTCMFGKHLARRGLFFYFKLVVTLKVAEKKSLRLGLKIEISEDVPVLTEF